MALLNAVLFAESHPSVPTVAAALNGSRHSDAGLPTNGTQDLDEEDAEEEEELQLTIHREIIESEDMRESDVRSGRGRRVSMML